MARLVCIRNPFAPRRSGRTFGCDRRPNPSSLMHQLKKLLDLLWIGLGLVGFFLACELLLILGTAMYLWLCSPARLAVRCEWPPTEETPTGKMIIREVITPQPLRVTPDETDVRIIDPRDPRLEAYLNGAATNAAIWANGKAFKSSGPAAWEIVTSAWRLWLLSPVALICWSLLRRSRRTWEVNTELRSVRPEPRAAPNGGPAERVADSGAASGPPSVS
jgi:hypothetical protein